MFVHCNSKPTHGVIANSRIIVLEDEPFSFSGMSQ